MDLNNILSSCPMDIALTNGPNGIPKEIEYQIICTINHEFYL